MAQPLAIAGLNGNFMPLAEVCISPLDRGFLFADSIYEVIPVYASTPLLLDAHVARLDRSLKAINIRNPHSDNAWQNLIAELVKLNGGGTMAIYIQVSRGVESGRNHAYSEDVQPTVFAMATELGGYQYEAGVTAIMLPDDRWNRCDIKSTALLPNILAQRKAAEAGAIDAILTDDGYVTEGAVSSIIIVENETLVRRPHGTEVLPGTTTDNVVNIAREAGFACREERVSIERLLAADEIWFTGAMKGIAPIVRIDDQIIGNGQPGPIWAAVNQLYEAQLHG
jgi:D-alanine transaminase